MTRWSPGSKSAWQPDDPLSSRQRETGDGGHTIPHFPASAVSFSLGPSPYGPTIGSAILYGKANIATHAPENGALSAHYTVPHHCRRPLLRHDPLPPACLLKDRRAPTSLGGSTNTLPDPLGVSQGVVPHGNDDSGRTFNSTTFAHNELSAPWQSARRNHFARSFGRSAVSASALNRRRDVRGQSCQAEKRQELTCPPNHARASTLPEMRPVFRCDVAASRTNSASSRLNRRVSSRKGACPTSGYQDAALVRHIFRI